MQCVALNAVLRVYGCNDIGLRKKQTAQAETGSASRLENHVRKKRNLPGMSNFFGDGPESVLKEKPDAIERETGRASKCENHVRKSVDFPGRPEFFADGPESVFDGKADAVKAETGRASSPKSERGKP